MLAAFRGTPQEIPLLRDWQRIRDQSTIDLEAFGGPKATGHWLRFEDFRVFGPEGWNLPRSRRVSFGSNLGDAEMRGVMSKFSLCKISFEQSRARLSDVRLLTGVVTRSSARGCEKSTSRFGPRARSSRKDTPH